MSEKPFAPSSDRNKVPILEVLRHEFQKAESVLEIGSGTGQHAVYFAADLTHLKWQTSDVAENHDDIHAWLHEANLHNVQDPLKLNVLEDTVPDTTYDGIFSANTAHIMSFRAVRKMFEIASDVLHDAGRFVLYGPFRQDGEFNTESNENFHKSLRQRDPQMGIRHLEELDQVAAKGVLNRVRLYAMPANNHIAVWTKGAA
jgi:cyclopropane fatty-acyl-phospholipid synthase-like methyltransferase